MCLQTDDFVLFSFLHFVLGFQFSFLLFIFLYGDDLFGFYVDQFLFEGVDFVHEGAEGHFHVDVGGLEFGEGVGFG